MLAPCCQSEPSGPMSLAGRRRICRILNTLLAIVDQPVLSNQARVPQHCFVCRMRVWGEQHSFSLRITGPVLLEKHKRLRFCPFYTFLAGHAEGIVC
ncbi:hypothetical protein VZT92_019545 [Zoarces viviparus]|uniref:Uncharacterized protein n=1 Tax=Zoarces viviparus TaxID=48416 RepID=A0AAW1ELS3_ZOAVI